MAFDRRLAAIMFTDIVGYTRMMQQSESRAVQVRNRHREVLLRLTTAHGGRVVQFYGDGTLTIFESSIEAVRCAIAIQHQLRLEPCVPLRIGIHQGETLFIGQEVVGDCVNLASRVESLAIAGAVLISHKVWEEIQNQEDLPAQLLGWFHLKNDARPRAIYALTTEGLVLPHPAQLRGKLEMGTGARIRSLAVLPIENFTGNDGLANPLGGLHDHLIMILSQIPCLRVVSRTSSLQYRFADKPIPQIARELRVEAIVEVALTQVNHCLQLNVQLLAAFPIEQHLWAGRFEHPIARIEGIFQEWVQLAGAGIEQALLPQGVTPDRVGLPGPRMG